MIIKVTNCSNFGLPEYKTEGSAGLDLIANIDKSYELLPQSRALISTGLKVEIPEGYELQIRPRSGLALKYGITVLNTPGTIDSDYRGDIGVILFNASRDSFIIKPGDRIAQAVLSKVERVQWLNCNSLDSTGRGEGGFGHTGV